MPSVCGPKRLAPRSRLPTHRRTRSAGIVLEVIRITGVCSFSQTRIPVLCGLFSRRPGIWRAPASRTSAGVHLTTSYAVDALDFARSISSP